MPVLVLFVLCSFGAIGFVDDWMKIVKKRSLGLSGRWKMLGLVVIATALAALGNVRTATMQAFSDREFEAIAGR